jgi:CRP/FNR family transcriptional regulator
VRAVPASQRHPRIFEQFDRLDDGHALLLVTDHEPRPLRAEFEHSRAGSFAWEQRRVAHDRWEAVIRKMPAQDPNDPLEVLRRCGIFVSAPVESLAHLAARARRVAVRRNRGVVEQGASWPYLAVVASGRVQAVLVTPDGRELAMYEVPAGDAFGAVSLVDGGTSPLRYVARAERTSVLLLPRDAVVELMGRVAGVSNAINALSAQRLRAVIERFSAHAAQPITARVADALLAYASPQPGLIDALPPLPSMRQTELAIVAGTAKDMVYRAIAELEEAGALERENGRIVRLDRSILNRFAEVLKY